METWNYRVWKEVLTRVFVSGVPRDLTISLELASNSSNYKSSN